MEHTCRIILLILINISQVRVSEVFITTDRVVQKGKAIKLNCTSNEKSLGNSAEFLVDGNTITSIKRNDGVCYKTVDYEECHHEVCLCDGNKRSYVLYYDSYNDKTSPTFNCKMKFKGNIIRNSNSESVTILDIQSPIVYTENNGPFMSGSTVKFICIMNKTTERVVIKWECGRFTYSNTISSINETTIWSDLSFTVDYTYHDKECTCIVQSKVSEFSVKKSITLEIIDKPVLTLKTKFHCNSSNTIAIPCFVTNGDHLTFQFTKWIHTIRGTYIRSLDGENSDDASILLIKRCNYQDGGEYTCKTRMNKTNGHVIVTETTTLIVDEIVVLPNSNLKRLRPGHAFSVSLYTQTPPISFDWYCNKIRINISNQIEKKLEQKEIMITMHNKNISLLGYEAEVFLCNSYCSGGRRKMCVSNERKHTCLNIGFVKEGKVKLEFIWIIIAVLITICVTTAFVGITVYLRKRRQTAILRRVEEDSYHNSGNQIEINRRSISTQQEDNRNRHQRTNQVFNRTAVADELTMNGYAIPNNELILYISSEVYHETESDYLDVQSDTNSLTTISSDGYEKVQ